MSRTFKIEQVRKRLASLWARRTELLPWWPYKLGYWTEVHRQRLLRKISQIAFCEDEGEI